MLYSVYISNSGRVKVTESLPEAEDTFKFYMRSAQEGKGRAAGQVITLVRDEDIMLMFDGTAHAG